MFKYTLLLFFRNLKRQKLFSAINLLGLTVSIAATLLIYIYVDHEFSYDRFHHDVDRIYRVNQTFIWGENNNSQFASTGPGVAYALKEELPEIDLITSIHTTGNFFISYVAGNNDVITFEETRVLAADSNFFRVFNFPLIKGNIESVFEQANNVLMTVSTAKKYFGDEDPIGKLVRIEGPDGEPKTYEVTGIAEDTPDNSYIRFDVLISMKSFPAVLRTWSWVWTQLETYIKLSPAADVNQVRAKLEKIPQKHAGQTLKNAFNTTWNEYIAAGKKWELFLQPMTKIHLPDKEVINRLSNSGNRTVIYSFIGAAVFIVLLSCINFMNLSTAQFTRRLKEAGVRKILGLGKKELSLGYFLEACIFCFIALVAGIALVQMFLPGFNLITEKSLQLNLLDGNLMLVAAGLVLLMAIVSGSYPAIFLSTFHPVEAMKGKVKTGREGKTFRNALVVFQFSVSIILIICTAVVFQQLKFVADKDIGFNRENLLVLRHVETLKSGESITHAALSVPGVSNVTLCTSVPPRIWGGDSFGVEENSEIMFPLNFTTADERYLPTLGVQLKIGRNFSIDNPGDVGRVIVNESTIKKIGWNVDESVIGKKLTYEENSFEIMGVMADFNYWPLSTPIEPMAVFHVNTRNLYAEVRQYLALRIEPQSGEAWKKTFSELEQVWKQHSGDTPFDYYFVDKAFAESFKSQQQFGSVLTVMAVLAIMIAALGLLGMIVYALEQRTKEIGIRKVSGASVWDILKLISKGYTWLILVAFVIGAPFSYWLMQQWLQDFAYRITPSIWIFVVTGLSTLVVAVLITSYHSVKAALTNPVEVLRDE
ncbi:MAG: ABC transporter permease [Cyclobacteriaceae bacterium]|nr:ABC transporter permease [Cyclobacteriaceae bacterium]UYN87010.1 MAG: ABC transporter permease [Cyclobacteriaceae bacterium]